MQITDEQIAAAARALANRNADICNVNREDNWMIYGDEFRESAQVALEAALAARAQSPVADGQSGAGVPTALLHDALFYLKGNLPDGHVDQARKVAVIEGLELLAASPAVPAQSGEAVAREPIDAIRDVIDSWDFYVGGGRTESDAVLFVQSMNRARGLLDPARGSTGRESAELVRRLRALQRNSIRPADLNAYATLDEVIATLASLSDASNEPEGPVAWRDPSNTEPAQSVTFIKEVAERYPHIYKQPLYVAPQPSQPAQSGEAKRFPTPISISTDKICEIAGKYNLGNPRLDALRGFVNEVILVNEAEYAKSE